MSGCAMTDPSRAGHRSLLSIITTLGLTTDLKLCLDAGDPVSYTSGNKWLDVAGSGYDFMLGSEATSPTTGDEPAFTGVVGGLSGAEYFELVNGDEYFLYDAASEAWMDTMHKDAAKWSFITAIYYVSDAAPQAIFANSDQGGISEGFRFITDASDKFNCKALNAGSSTFNDTSTLGPNDVSWNVVGVQVDETAGAAASFFFANGSTDTFDATMTGPSSAAPDFPLAMGAQPNVGLDKIMTAGTRFGAAAVWQGGTALTAANFGAIATQLGARFGLSI